MEPCGAFFDEEWESLSKFFSTEEDNFLFHVSNLFSNNNEIQPNIMSTDDENPFSNQVGDIPFYQDESSYTLESLDSYTMCYNNGPVFVEDGTQETLQLNQESCNNQTTDNDDTELFPKEEPCNDKPSKNPKKRSRVSKKSNAEKTKRPRKSKKGIQSEEQNNTEANGSNSEETSNHSQEISEESLSEPNELQNLSGKARKTKKVSATDPQSLYARRRRERINEKLKILQNLVPNGTKVDLSTMLEEAVHYVKFLQLQIKLLSSDDMWMYSPIAYNGMDMGFYQSTILPNLLSLHT